MARTNTPWYVVHRLPAMAMFLTLMMLAGCSGGKPDGRGAKSLGAPTVPAHPGIVFEPELLQLGTIAPGGVAEGRVTVRNITDRPVALIELLASCECTTADLPVPGKLAPREAITFPVKLDLSELLRGGLPTSDRPGPELLFRELGLRVGSSKVATLGIELHLSDRLVVTPPAVRIGSRLVGETAEAEVLVSPGRESETLTVLSVSSEDPLLKAQVIPEGLGARLLLSWGPFNKVGPVAAQLSILTDQESFPGLVQLGGDVLSPLQVSPRDIVSLKLRAGQPLVRRVKLERRDGGPLDVSSVASPSGRVASRLLPSREPSKKEIEVVVQVPPAPATVTTELVIRTNVDGAKRLVIPIQAGQAAGR